jgi:glucose-6-phosphate isomerase
MISKNISFKNFRFKTNNRKIEKELKLLIKDNDSIIQSLGPNYKNVNYKKIILNLKKYFNVRIIGMGGSILGTEAIYDFLKYKIKKNFYFINNLILRTENKIHKKKMLNIIVSKSGNTIETISNVNIILKKKSKSIFITENKDSYLLKLAKKMQGEIIHHNNYIGGRYSVLSEVGMLPAEMMGLNVKKFKQINNLIKDRKFINSLIGNVSNTLNLLKKKRFNSIILNYDEKSDNLFKWYQQLIAESLGKKGKGILPIVSSVPKDNHSTMQLYLDGPKNNFFTFFYVKENRSPKINGNNILQSYDYLKNKTLDEIMFAQMKATQKVFLKKKIPFRSFEIKKRDEKTLGELFCFFILETILLGRALKVNPYDQPSVELIKKETTKILI